MTSENFSKKSLPDHLKVPWGIKEAAIVYIFPWIVLPSLVVIILSALSPYVPLFNLFLDGLRDKTVIANFIFVLIVAIGELAVVAWYLKKYKIGLAQVGWRRFNFWQALGLLGLMFIVFSMGVFALIVLVSYLLPAFDANQAQTNEFTSQTISHPILTLLSLVIIPPIVEETVFRGFIFPGIAKKYGLIAGALVSSVLFGFAHLQANVSIYTFVLGLALCFMYVRLRSIVPGIALHMLNNFLAFYQIGHHK